MFRLSSVNVDEDEQVLMEVEDFSSISDAKTAGQVGLMPAGIEGEIEVKAIDQLQKEQ